MRPVLGARSNPCRARCVVFGIIRSVGARGGLQSAKRRRECWPGCLEKGLTRTNVVLSRIDEFHPSPPATSPASCQLHPPRPAIYFGKTKCQGCRRAGKWGSVAPPALSKVGQRGRSCIFHKCHAQLHVSIWKTSVAAIRVTTKFIMFFYNFCCYLWGQCWCWTETNILVTICLFFTSFHCPQLL